MLTPQDVLDNPYLLVVIIPTLAIMTIAIRLPDYKFSYNRCAVCITILMFLPNTVIEIYNAFNGCFVPWEDRSLEPYNMTIVAINIFMFLLYCILLRCSGSPIGRYITHSLFYMVNFFVKIMIFCTMRPALFYHNGSVVVSERSRKRLCVLLCECINLLSM